MGHAVMCTIAHALIMLYTALCVSTFTSYTCTLQTCRRVVWIIPTLKTKLNRLPPKQPQCLTYNLQIMLIQSAVQMLIQKRLIMMMNYIATIILTLMQNYYQLSAIKIMNHIAPSHVMLILTLIWQLSAIKIRNHVAPSHVMLILTLIWN